MDWQETGLSVGESGASAMMIRRYPHRHHKPLYETPLSDHLMSITIAIIAVVGLTALLVHFVHPRNSFDINRISFNDVAVGTLNTLYRMTLSFILSLAVSMPLALFMASTPGRQRILLPVADILQSVPVLAFFPVVAAFFVAKNAFEPAAVFVIFVSMVWNIVFPVVGGLQTIPSIVADALNFFPRVRSSAALGPCRLGDKIITSPQLTPNQLESVSAARKTPLLA
jgi:hypothetical protein